MASQDQDVSGATAPQQQHRTTDKLLVAAMAATAIVKLREHDTPPEHRGVEELKGARPRAPSFTEDSSNRMLPLAAMPMGLQAVDMDERFDCSDELPDLEAIKGLLSTQGVQVERIVGSWPNVFVLVRVLEWGAPKKRVFVRRTTNNWQSYRDFDCEFVRAENTSCQFVATIRVPPLKDHHKSRSPSSPSPTSDIEAFEFAVCYQCGDREYWDNNGGTNYKLTISHSGQSSPPTRPRRLSFTTNTHASSFDEDH